MYIAHSKIQSMSQGGLGMAPENFTLRLNLVISAAKIAMLRTDSGKSVISEISLAVHARVAYPEGEESPP